MIDDMATIFHAVQTRYNLNMGDFPPMEHFQTIMRTLEVSQLAPLKLQLIDQLDVILEREVPRLMENLPGETQGAEDAEGAPRLLAAMEAGIRIVKHGNPTSYV